MSFSVRVSAKRGRIGKKRQVQDTIIRFETDPNQVLSNRSRAFEQAIEGAMWHHIPRFGEVVVHSDTFSNNEVRGSVIDGRGTTIAELTIRIEA